jgi:RNA polymerase sigma-70 factor (ECF subfamily)
MITTGDGLDADMSAVVKAAVTGDRAAVERLLAAIRPVVVRYCRARVGSVERSFGSADDVAQEVCLAVLRALPSYQDQGRPFLSFVYGIAAHKVADAHRVIMRGQRVESYAEMPDAPAKGLLPDQLAINAETSSAMERLLAELPALQREIVVLRVVVGLSAEETAQMVGSSPGAVRVAQHRALSKLRNLIQPEEVA